SGFVFQGNQVAQRANVVTQSTNQGAGTPASELPRPASSEGGTSAPDKTAVEQAYGRLPLSFEANLGQIDSQVQFLVHAPSYTLFLTGTESVMVVNGEPSPTREHGSGVHTRPLGATEQTVSASPTQPEVVRMQLAGANP